MIMRKLFAMVVIGLSVAVGFGAMNNVSACDTCETKTYEEMTDKEFAMHVRDTHIERDLCTEEHYECIECGGYFCDNLTCWCGEEIMSISITNEELNAFDCYVWNELYMKSCVNYCEECDIEYYEHCSCECREELGDEFTSYDEEYCWEYDYQLFIEDNYDMIMDKFMRYANALNEPVVEVNEPMIICEF